MAEECWRRKTVNSNAVDRCQHLNYSIYITGGRLKGLHPNKHIQAAIEYAVSKGWALVPSGKSAHCYAKLRCGIPGHRDHTMSIWSTPRDAENHAKQIVRKVNECSPLILET